jgi:hypothetical protein
MPETTNDEIRYKILQVLYEIALRGTDWRVQRSYLKTKLNVDEKLIDFNVFYLDSRKLAQVVGLKDGNWGQVRITGEGIDVYEHKLQFVNQFPFMQIAIQKIDGSVYGSAVQAVDSKVSLNQRITDSFKQAYSLVESERNVSDEQKTKIEENLGELEEEIKAKNLDIGKVRRLWDWIKDNANWIVPTLKEIIEDILKTLG